MEIKAIVVDCWVCRVTFAEHGCFQCMEAGLSGRRGETVLCRVVGASAAGSGPVPAPNPE